MKGRALVALWIVLFCPLITGSTKPAPSCQIPKKQYVAVSFERFNRRGGTVVLELRNETAWPIRVPVELDPAFVRKKLVGNGQELPVRYYIEEYDPRPWMQMTTPDGRKHPHDEPSHPPVPKIRRVDFHTDVLIPVGKTIFFKVPKEHLARNCVLTVNLRYEWEDGSTEDLSGPVHFVQFRGVELPDEVQKEIP